MLRSRLAQTDLRTALLNFLFLTSGALLLAVNLNLFLAPSDIAPGGVSGSAIIINHFTGWPIGMTMLLLNIPMVMLGFRFLGGFHFLSRTLYAVLLYSLGVDILVHWLPPSGITDNALLNALYGGIVGGLGMGLVYRGGGTTAGSGILGRVLQIKTGIPVSQIYLLTDGSVVLVASLVFGWESGLYALITIFVWGLTADYVLEGPSVVRTAFIVTDKPEAVARAVLTELRLGLTSWSAEGMYTQAKHTVLFCTLSRPYVPALRRVVRAADPNSFLVIGHGHQASGGVFGQPQRSGRKRDPDQVKDTEGEPHHQTS
jgi:uncharacterized membrane-anchored protein YitT (DUF2179 family)